MVGIIVVDVQNDFVGQGALPVPGGLEIIPTINRLIKELGNNAIVITTQDWHPADHSQFITNGGQWPVHCVAETYGSELCEELDEPEDAIRILKGTSRALNGYSAFEGRGKASDLTLDEILKIKGIDTVYVCGLATDYCVRATALDARKLGYQVYLMTNGIAGVAADTTKQALEDMTLAGVVFHKLGTGE